LIQVVCFAPIIVTIIAPDGRGKSAQIEDRRRGLRTS
jgi:hypothetical protein